MRTKKEVLNDLNEINKPSIDYLLLEILLDIRDQNEEIKKELHKIFIKP